MIFKFLLIFAGIVFFSEAVSAQPSREVVGYFASWKWYKRNNLVNPQTIRYSNYTIINYAFFKPLPDGNIKSGDPFADATLLKGKEIMQHGLMQHDHTTSLIYNAHLNGVKVIASIGGYTWSKVFPGIAADAKKRATFAKACSELITTYGFDGIDIDWEFPGNQKQNGTPSDKENFTLLLKNVRLELDEVAGSSGNKLLLTAAIGPSPEHMKSISWNDVVPLLDLIHIMTYNYHGAWEKTTNHNAPLHKTFGNAACNVNHTINLLLNVHEVPSSKITLGLAFYGRSAVTPAAASLHGRSLGASDKSTFADGLGSPSYYSILSKSELYEKKFDNIARVPYLVGKNKLKSFVSYDDPVSIKEKAEYAMEKLLRGVVIWDISGDYIETFPGSGIISGTPLCDAINEGFKHSVPVYGLQIHSRDGTDIQITDHLK